jgi:hypothetical protein
MTNATTSLIEDLLAPQAPAQLPPAVRGVTVDAEGANRSTIDFEAAKAAGFAAQQSIYTRGTMVVQAGIDRAREYRQEFDRMPLVSTLCADGIDRIRAEDRRDVEVNISDLAMTKEGDLLFKDDQGGTRKMPLEKGCFGKLVSRIGIPGGGQYLGACWPELRAVNFNHWTRRISQSVDMKDPRLVIRTRKAEQGRDRQGFAVVSPKYTSYDCDKVLEAVQLAAPQGARGELIYDGASARVRVLFNTDVQPENFVAGEFFRGGVSINLSDDASGGLNGSTLLWQNLCLNMGIIDISSAGLFRIRHIGSVRVLADKFRAGFEKALGTIEHFTKQWGFASRDNVVAAARAADKSIPTGLNVDEVFPGIFRGILDNEIVNVKGDSESVVGALMDCWRQDASSATSEQPMSRAAVVNAFTRYAHTKQYDAWAQDGIQAQAAQLVYSARALPWSPAPRN